RRVLFRSEEAEASVQDREEGGLGSPALAGRLALRIIAPLVEPGLDQLNVGIAQVAPDKLVEDLGRLTRVEPLQEPVDLGSRPLVPGQNPAVGQGEGLPLLPG